MAGFGAGPNLEARLKLKNDWKGFDLVKVEDQAPMTFRRGDLFIVSGCITTTTPMKNTAGWSLTIAYVDPRCSPPNDVAFLAPTSMSRYEGIYQAGTSAALRTNGQLQIWFSKSTNPMVLHLSGLCCVLSGEEPIPIPIAEYEMREWFQQSTKHRAGEVPEEVTPALEAEVNAPPALHQCGNIVCLQGELKEATFGPLAQNVGTLPEGFRPRRELRLLASLLRCELMAEQHVIDHSVAVTLRPNGQISVQGGKVHMVDAKGSMKVLQQKKRGRLCLDGIRFALVDGEPIQPSAQLVAAQQLAAAPPERATGTEKVGYLMPDGGARSSTAVCVRQGDVVLLEGHLAWDLPRPPNTKQPLATLPKGCWPLHREVFFTRGGSDLEERRRVDVDQYGRIFCPEGISGGRMELSGVIFIASKQPGPKPREPDWDELKLQYHRSDVDVVSTSFDGHELLELFVRRSNYHEWHFMEWDFTRHAHRKMLLPLGPVPLRGGTGHNQMNLSMRDDRIWREHKSMLSDRFGITTFHTLMHLSDETFNRVARAVNMKEDDRVYLFDKRRRLWLEWGAQRQPGLNFQYLQRLSTEIVDQMFEHWDFKAQLQGALQNDYRAPATIEHLFPQRKSGQDWFIKKKIKNEEMKRFEEARQFFYLYETTGSNMTHCSLMGASDVFTTTGKWYFPDAIEVQRQLFEHIQWLFPRNIYLYMSERQTSRFPFIEDLDIQCHPDWEGPRDPSLKPNPPDRMIMHPPQRDGETVHGDPGEMMRWRALAVHMIYPNLDHLDCLVYSASGYNKGKDMLKSSFHLVWPQLIVDPDRAPVIRHVTLGVFQRETKKSGSFLQQLQQRLLELHQSNNWELVFDSTTINARNGLRLPYNDKASMVIEDPDEKRKVQAGTLSKTKAQKKRVMENRPSKAIGRIRFEFDKDPETGTDIITSARWDADNTTYPIAKWIEMGSCRREPGLVELTHWQVGPDVLAMLPTKPGEAFYYEDEEDGAGGHWVTHKPFPNIRRCKMETREFQKQFTDMLSDEQAQLTIEHNLDILRRVIGSWISVTDKQAIWRATACVQCEAKIPDGMWGARAILRPAEVAFFAAKGKVLVDGPHEVVEVLIRVLKSWTKGDDNAVMPKYDLKKMN